MRVNSKLKLKEERLEISSGKVRDVIVPIFVALGCLKDSALTISNHLIDSSLSGMESHGIMRCLQYAEQIQSGYIKKTSKPKIYTSKRGAQIVDGGGFIGIPAMQMAYEKGSNQALEKGISVIAVKNLGHTGRHGAYAEKAARDGFLTICIGGGGRKRWPQVAPHGGSKGRLPTNPWCVGIPGGEKGPVILDFATSKISGGWIYAAQSAEALLPEGCLIDKNGSLTRDPNEYFKGGAILPAGGYKGYGLALIGELIAEAVIGEVSGDANWLIIFLNTKLYQEKNNLMAKAEEILSDIRNCPPADDFQKVEIPGEREREHFKSSKGKIAIPKKTWEQILNLSDSLKIKQDFN